MSRKNNHLFNDKDYMCVRRLISFLTNDNSEKLIVEKLKGKNLSSLLYNAKLIDNSQNMATKKRILGCVIRAIEKEKHFCRRRGLEQSWGRKLLSSFNCLNPSKPITEELSERSVNKSCTVHSKKQNRKENRHQELAKRRHNQSVGSGSKLLGNKGSVICSTTVSEKKNSEKNSVQYNVDGPVVQQDQPISARCTFLVQKKVYETICPPNLGVQQPKYVKYIYVDSVKKANSPNMQAARFVDKKTSSTQTLGCEDEPAKEQDANPSNIKLQDLLEAATSLINTRDQKEYVKSFLSNFEPPFDLTSGFPPYLKLPMKNIDDFVGKESVYGSNSENSVISGRVHPRKDFETNYGDQEEDKVKKYVRELSDPWQEAAESIISGVINETLPHDKADYSQLGACILKRLGAYPNSSLKDHKVSRMNTTVPEIVLSCTEWFESGAGESDKKSEKTKCEKNGMIKSEKTIDPHNQSSESIEEIKLIDGDSGHSKVSWEQRRLQNYCFYDGSDSKAKVGLLDVSEGSIGEVGTITSEEVVHEVTKDGDHAQDRKLFPRREPLTISPSVLDQANDKDKLTYRKSAGDAVRWCDSHKIQKSQQEKKTTCKAKSNVKVDCKVAPNTSKSSNEEDSCSNLIETVVEENISATVANLSVFLPDQPVPQPKELSISTNVSTPDKEEQPSPEVVLWEPTVAEVETFDGLGECHSKLTDLPKITKSLSNRKICPGKSRMRTSIQDKFRGKKKCKNQGKNKKSEKEEVDITRNCKVM